jgi:hypothetical protein
MQELLSHLWCKTIRLWQFGRIPGSELFFFVISYGYVFTLDGKAVAREPFSGTSRIRDRGFHEKCTVAQADSAASEMIIADAG